MAFLTVIIAGIVGFIAFVILMVITAECKGFDTDQILPATVFIICALSFVLTVVHMNNISCEKKWDTTWRTDIVALKDNSNVKGYISCGIFVTSGQIEEKMYYYCMENTKDGKHVIKVPAENSYIVETNEQTPQIVAQVNKYADKRMEFWDCFYSYDEKYIIYVPKGTVDATYKIDME